MLIYHLLSSFAAEDNDEISEIRILTKAGFLDWSESDNDPKYASISKMYLTETL